jgi:hypothetical protein
MMMTDSPSTVELVLEPTAGLQRARWKSIVIHHSDSAFGDQASLEKDARLRNLKGIGYHFVIGNGNGMGDGELFVTPRWNQQRQGAHVAGGKGTPAPAPGGCSLPQCGMGGCGGMGG